MLGRRLPESVFGSIVVCDEWMLQTEPICNGANACPLKSAFSKLRNGGVQDRGSRVERSLLFGPLAWMPAPPRGRGHLGLLRHFHWYAQAAAADFSWPSHAPMQILALDDSILSRLLPFEHEGRRFDILVEGISGVRESALRVGAVVKLDGHIEHHEVRGRHTSARPRLEQSARRGV